MVFETRPKALYRNKTEYEIKSKMVLKFIVGH
jgi:hypothetical protein